MYISTLKSLPVVKESLVIAYNINNLITAAKIVTTIKKIVIGRINWLDSFISKILIIGCIYEFSKIISGLVKTPRNGITAPILTISAKEASIIKTKTKVN